MSVVLAFDIGYHHFAWAKVRYAQEYPQVISIDCHDFASSHLATIYPMLVRYLDSINMKEVDTVLVEHQMNRMNIKATKISVFVYAFFLIRYPGLHVIEYSSVHKTRVFGQKDLTKSERKKWGIHYVQTQVCKDDPVLLDWLDQFSKQDDICDCILMILSYWKKKIQV